jgi:putative ABC transport system permease protein
MNLWEGFLVALENLRSSKMRSALTMLGIIIGVASVIAVVAIGQGGRAVVLNEFNQFGSNLLMFYYKGAMDGQVVNSKDYLTMQDAEAIKRQISGIVEVAPGTNGRGEARVKKVKKNLSVTATTESYKRVGNIDLVAGRFFTDAEDRAKMKVAVVEEKLIKEFGLSGTGVGQRIYINDLPYTIIGVLKSQTSALNFGPPSFNAYLPLGAWGLTAGGASADIQWIQAKKPEGANEKELGDKIVALLHSRHHNKDKYAMQSIEQIKASADKATNILSLIIGSIAGISLLVGGIGVMNIMLVSVTERTREIGIRKALGATHSDVLRQFLLESSLLCLMGGVVGIILGTGLAYIVAKFAKWPPLVSLSTVGIAVGFSIVVGLFFGLYPASRAARLDPIEALRYE